MYLLVQQLVHQWAYRLDLIIELYWYKALFKAAVVIFLQFVSYGPFEKKFQITTKLRVLIWLKCLYPTFLGFFYNFSKRIFLELFNFSFVCLQNTNMFLKFCFFFKTWWKILTGSIWTLFGLYQKFNNIDIRNVVHENKFL